jgi:hypothetical protein
MAQSSKEIALEDFDTLTLNSVFEVYLIQGTENKIKLEGAENILKKVEINNSNKTLKLINTYKANWLHPSNNKIKIYLTIKNIRRINANETCNIQSMNTIIGNEIGVVLTSKYNQANLDLDCNTFYYWNNFPTGGNVKLSGKTKELKILNVALMAIDARDLVADYVSITNTSKGDCKVTCRQRISYKIAGTGNIYLNGNPSLIEKIEGSSTGKLIIE